MACSATQEAGCCARLDIHLCALTCADPAVAPVAPPTPAGPYETYEGSPVSQGIIQPDM